MIRNILTALLIFIGASAISGSERSETMTGKDYSGWRGGIGITFGSPSRRIPDIMELGYEIMWGEEDYPEAVNSILGVSIFRYWNNVVECMLKDPGGKYDFSNMEDKQKASELAFDAWAEMQLETKGLSKYATVKYHPEGAYGDVYGAMDYSSENPLVNALVDSYLKWFKDNKIKTGGIALDNAGKLPENFLRSLRKRFIAQGLGIATNGCPEALLPYIDFFGEEGFPFTVPQAVEMRKKGLKGILGEFTMQHLSAGELESYIKTKMFNGIVFFGYTNGGVAAGAGHSFYCSRPDVYNHQRWILRKYVALSRAVVSVGRQEEPFAYLGKKTQDAGSVDSETRAKHRDDGAVYEWDRKYNVKELMDRVTGESFITRFGDAKTGLYFYVNSSNAETVECDVKQLGVGEKTLVFDEFNEKIIESKFSGDKLIFALNKTPGLVQLGTKETIARNILSRVAVMFENQIKQKKLDDKKLLAYPIKQWAPFCHGYEIDNKVKRTGISCARVKGGKYGWFTGKFQYVERMGTAQFVNLNQNKPDTVTLIVWSKCEDVEKSEPVVLKTWEQRDKHFSAREGSTYCAHLYIDYQDGQWPEVHTVLFSAGAHDWEEKIITVKPDRPIKTAMVLLEFHQPKGNAWFDDVTLVEGSNPSENLLAYPGFEKDETVAGKMEKFNKAYMEKIESIIEKLRNTGATESVLSGIRQEMEDIEQTIKKEGHDKYFGYELRDIEDAKIKLGLCAYILSQ